MPRQRTWLFDLDNTLHDAEARIFPHLDRAMTAYIREHLAVDEATADHLRALYWRRYGATLRGLVRHHGVDPAHFLQETHRIPELRAHLIAEPGLAALLERLPGRKIIFSNAPAAYVQQVLTGLGIARCFAKVYCIEQLDYLPKPHAGAFLRLLQRERLAPRQCILVEDTRANLATAKRLGMKTVWIAPGTRRAACTDVRVNRLLDLPAHLGRL